MDFRQSYDFSQIVNEAERIVIDRLGQSLKDPANSSVCTCQECVLDMAAYTLNHVKPMYRVSLLGTLYSQSMNEGEYQEEVRKAVEEAITKIKQNPSHD